MYHLFFILLRNVGVNVADFSVSFGVFVVTDIIFIIGIALGMSASSGIALFLFRLLAFFLLLLAFFLLLDACAGRYTNRSDTASKGWDTYQSLVLLRYCLKRANK